MTVTTSTCACLRLSRSGSWPHWAALLLVAVVTKDTVLLPFTEHVGDAHKHQYHHRDGMRQGQMAEGHVGVVYLEGDGDFVFTDTATGDEERVAIVPGKMISWPNKGFRHRVEQGSMPRRLLGPMVLDATSGSLLGVGSFSRALIWWATSVWHLRRQNQMEHFLTYLTAQFIVSLTSS